MPSMTSSQCLLCGQPVDVRDMALHAHRYHPGADAWPVCWPDGEPVMFEDPELIAEV